MESYINIDWLKKEKDYIREIFRTILLTGKKILLFLKGYLLYGLSLKLMLSKKLITIETVLGYWGIKVQFPKYFVLVSTSTKLLFLKLPKKNLNKE